MDISRKPPEEKPGLHPSVALQCVRLYADLTVFVSKLHLSAFCCQKEINNKTNSRLTISDISAHQQAILISACIQEAHLSRQSMVSQAVHLTLSGSKESKGAGPQFPLGAHSQ